MSGVTSSVPREKWALQRKAEFQTLLPRHQSLVRGHEGPQSCGLVLGQDRVSRNILSKSVPCLPWGLYSTWAGARLGD